MMTTEQTVWRAEVGKPAVRTSWWRSRILILGTGTLATELCRVLQASRLGLDDIVGFVDRDSDMVGKSIAGFKVLGTFDQLFEIVEQHRAHVIAVCLEDRRAQLPVQALLDLKVLGIDVVDGHSLYEQASSRVFIDLLRPSALIFSTGFRRRFVTMALKRAIDVAIALCGLVLLAPLMVCIAVLIKLDSPGPVIYRQTRVGLRGHPYVILKFRSMVQDAEKSGPRWAEVGDPCISRVGKWIRKTRIDELPQLINVLYGEMSLVGPRPERPVFVQQLRERIPYYDLRHTVRPGITGWAQTRFRYGASVEDSLVKLQYDLYYVKNMSLALDLRILVETARVVLCGEGAR
jgi:sugar transferase (PEP-CTERM system associated)